MPSTSRNRLSDGQNVFRGVLVSVQMLAAVFTIELAHFQTKLGVNVSTRITAFAARKEPVGHPQFFSIPRGLVGQHSSELSKARASNMLGEATITNHPAHVQILDCQNIEPSHEIGCQLVETVFAAVRNVRLLTSDLELLPSPSSASFYAPRQNSLQPCELFSMLGCVPWVGDSLPGGERCQPRDSKINPDLPTSLWERDFVRFIQTKAHEVSPSTVLGYRDGCGFAREFAAPSNAEATDLGNCKIAVLGVPFKTVDRVFGGLLSMLGTKPWVCRTLGKEIRKRSLQVPQCLLLWNAGTFTQPREFWVCSMLGHRLTAGIVVDGLPGLEAVGAKPERKIVGMASTAKGASKQPFLPFAWVNSVCHSLLHKNNMALVRNIVNPESRPKGRGFQPIGIR